MITRKFNIVNNNDRHFIKKKVENYSYAVKLMWKMLEEASNKDFIDKFKNRFNLNDIEYRSLKSSVEAKYNALKKNNENKLNEINDLEYKLTNNNKLTKRDKYKIFNKIAFLKQSIDNNIVFGGRNLLQKITREYNKKSNKNLNNLNHYINEYQYKRNNIPFFIVGEANQKGNRFFDFNQINNGLVIYKPFKGKKIEINFKLPKKFLNEFIKLADLIDRNEIAVSVSLNLEYVYFTFDEEKLNGYALNEIDRRIEVKDIKKQALPKEIEKEEIKKVYKKYYDEQLERKLIGKIKERCIAIDLNPTNIGFSIIQKTDDNKCKLIHCGWFDLSKLCIKLGKKSNDKTQIYQNNKRKYELTIILKKLFAIANHYKCSSFIMEDLNGKFKSEINETNRKVKNLWNKDLLINIITRRCNECGIELVKVNPCYTSFIGNIRHPYVDAVNASIEIGRRGLLRYISGTFYPHICLEDLSTTEAKFGIDVSNGTLSEWVKLYKFLKTHYPQGNEFSDRLRTALNNLSNDNYSLFSMSSHSSMVTYINFIIIYHTIC